MTVRFLGLSSGRILFRGVQNVSLHTTERMRITKLLLGVGGSKAIVRQVVDHLLWAVQSENFRLDVLRESTPRPTI